MDSSTTPHICETCGLSYVVDDAAESHMSPPYDYRFGHESYCLACWLGVGPKEPDLLGVAANPVPRRHAKLDRMKLKEQTPQKPSVYLWLCCEGWMKFGPFEWLRFDDESQRILGPEGEEVAKKSGDYWRVPSGRSEGMQFSNPTITTTPFHPHKDCGSHPGPFR
jgi:hypothetical protein